MVVLENVTVEIPVLVQDNASSSFKHEITRRVGGVISNRTRHRRTIRALHNVSITIPPGGRLGLVGHNGAGKTTLLKTLAGLYPVSAGRVQVDGTIRTFFNLSAGLDLSQSGLANIKNVALYYTQSLKEIDEITPKVVEFSELGEFIDMPVGTYSAGMLARLIVSIALNFEGDVLVMDEMLGAGDAMFMSKVKKRVESMMSEAQILVFASHATEIIRQFCTTAIWLEKGEVAMHGDVAAVTAAFHGTVRN
jgi:ABC-type polysaccharide/polyol phosphate transport system ATPase subunit